MSKTFVPSPRTPAVLTANNLLDGLSVWMSSKGWTTDPRAATLYEDPAAAETALLAAQAQPDVVVGPYLVESGRGANGLPIPVHFREAFRQAGPSVETNATSTLEAAHA